MSKACMPDRPSASQRCVSQLMESAAWIGLACGLLCIGASAAAATPGRMRAASSWPTPQEISSYTSAICGAILTVANAAFVIWHRLQRRPPRPRKRRKKKADAANPPIDP